MLSSGTLSAQQNKIPVSFHLADGSYHTYDISSIDKFTFTNDSSKLLLTVYRNDTTNQTFYIPFIYNISFYGSDILRVNFTDDSVYDINICNIDSITIKENNNLYKSATVTIQGINWVYHKTKTED